MIASNSGWAVAALVVLVPLVARAEPGPLPPTEEQVEAARALYHDARELRRQGRLHEAVAKALQAYGIASTPVTALEAGELLVESGRLVEAREVVRSVTQMPVSPRESDKGRDARQLAASLGAQLDMRIPKIAVATRPAGVTVSLDGKTLASTDPAAWLGVDPGPHVMVVRVEDRACTTINLTLVEGEERTVELHDAASACRPEPPRFVPPSLPPATPPAATPTLPPSPPPPPPPEREAGLTGWQWGGMSLAAAGVITVGIGGYLAFHARDDYRAVAGECPSAGCNLDGYHARTSAIDEANVATALVVTGAVALAGGLGMWFLSPSRSARVQAVVGPGRVGLAGSF